MTLMFAKAQAIAAAQYANATLVRFHKLPYLYEN